MEGWLEGIIKRRVKRWFASLDGGQVQERAIRSQRKFDPWLRRMFPIIVAASAWSWGVAVLLHAGAISWEAAAALWFAAPLSGLRT